MKTTNALLLGGAAAYAVYLLAKSKQPAAPTAPVVVVPPVTQSPDQPVLVSLLPSSPNQFPQISPIFATNTAIGASVRQYGNCQCANGSLCVGQGDCRCCDKQGGPKTFGNCQCRNGKQCVGSGNCACCDRQAVHTIILPFAKQQAVRSNAASVNIGRCHYAYAM